MFEFVLNTLRKKVHRYIQNEKCFVTHNWRLQRLKAIYARGLNLSNFAGNLPNSCAITDYTGCNVTQDKCLCAWVVAKMARLLISCMIIAWWLQWYSGMVAVVFSVVARMQVGGCMLDVVFRVIGLVFRVVGGQLPGGCCTVC